MEEVAPEAPRPDYSPSELGQLVCYLRDMVVLFDLRDCDWNNTDCLTLIEKWFLEIHQPVLFIFYSPENVLCGSLTAPLTPFYDATYFIRRPNEIFQVDTFHDTIQYGTLHDPDESLLILMEAIYGPHFFQQPSPDWSERVQVNFLNAIDDFLINLTDLHYKVSGLTILAMPPLQEDVPVEDEFTVRRLEKLIIHWMGQMRLFLGDNGTKELLCPSDCYDFWVYRDEVLHGLNLQFERTDVQTVLNVLQTKQSIYIEQFNELVQECLTEVDRAKDNIRFLALLIDPCKQLEDCQSPADIPRLLPEIIQRILYIERHSRFLKGKEVMGLFRSLTNHIILYCRSKINIPDILQGFPREGIKLCSMSIDCCLAYREIYGAIVGVGENGASLDETVIFNPIDTFVERLHDMILICEYSEIDSMEVPQFGGTWGREFERTCEEMSGIFHCALGEIKQRQHLALDVTDDHWSTTVIAQFKRTLRQLDEIFQNMIKSSFIHCRNLDDRIEILCTLINYQNRVSLTECFTEYIDHLYDFAMDEIASIKSFILEERTQKRKYSLCERHSGYGFFLLANLKRTRTLKDAITSLTWLREETPAAVHLEVEILEKLIQQDIQANFEEWKGSIPDNMINCLQRALLVRSLSRPGLLECNIDRNLVVLLREATAFKRLQFATPINITQLFLKCSQINLIFESAVHMCLDYNSIVCSLTEKERLLFRALIKTCDKKITAGIYKLNWAGELADNYTSECLQMTAQIQSFLTGYKFANTRIVELCGHICEQEIMHLFVRQLSDLSTIEERLESTRASGCEKLMHYYREIVEQIVAVHDGFAHYTDSPLLVTAEEENVEWCDYVKKIDKLLEKAFCHCVQRNLLNILNQLCGTNSLRISPFVRVQVALDAETHSLLFQPEIGSISQFLGSLFARLLSSFKLFRRLQFHLRIPVKPQAKDLQPSGYLQVLKTNDKCLEYQRIILQGMW